MRRLSLVLLTLLASFGMVVIAGSGPALACSCALMKTAGYVGLADEVYVGTLVEMKDPPQRPIMSSGDPITYTVAVESVFKGDVGVTAEFESARMGASCGLEGMVVDQRYVVFTTDEGSVPTASLCGGTAPATATGLTAVERLLGTPTPPVAVQDAVARRPTSTRSPAAWTSGWAVGGGLLGGAMLLAAGLRLRRSR